MGETSVSPFILYIEIKMPKKTKSSETSPTATDSKEKQTVTLSSKEIARAVTNDPDLSEREFQFAGRTFKIVDLRYRDYMKFVALLEPLFDILRKKNGPAQDEGLPGIDLTPANSMVFMDVVKYCGNDLPKLVQIIINQTEPEYTHEHVIDNAKSPMELAGIVMQQVAQNNMIQDVMTFFAHLLPTVNRVRAMADTITSSQQ
jgi:hypothetical protein